MLKDHRLIRTPQQLLVDAEKKIAELERHNEWLKERVSYLIICLEALDDHYKIGGIQNAKPIFDAFVEKEDAKLKETLDLAKKEFAQNVKDGKIEIISRDESLRKPESN